MYTLIIATLIAILLSTSVTDKGFLSVSTSYADEGGGEE